MTVSFQPTICGRWQIDLAPPNQDALAMPLVDIILSPIPGQVPGAVTSLGTSELTATGFNAVLAQIEGYHTAAKVQSLISQGPRHEVVAHTSFRQSIYTVLPADLATQIAAMVTILNTAANVT